MTPLTPATDYQAVAAAGGRTSGHTKGRTKGRTTPRPLVKISRLYFFTRGRDVFLRGRDVLLVQVSVPVRALVLPLVLPSAAAIA